MLAYTKFWQDRKEPNRLRGAVEGYITRHCEEIHVFEFWLRHNTGVREVNVPDAETYSWVPILPINS